MKPAYFRQIEDMCGRLYPANMNIDYVPANFVVQNDALYYIDYECNDYMEDTNRVKYHAAGINRGEFPPACGEALGCCILYVVPYICIITKQQANDDRYRRSLLFFIL